MYHAKPVCLEIERAEKKKKEFYEIYVGFAAFKGYDSSRSCEQKNIFTFLIYDSFERGWLILSTGERHCVVPRPQFVSGHVVRGEKCG